MKLPFKVTVPCTVSVARDGNPVVMLEGEVVLRRRLDAVRDYVASGCDMVNLSVPLGPRWSWVAMWTRGMGYILAVWGNDEKLMRTLVEADESVDYDDAERREIEEHGDTVAAATRVRRLAVAFADRAREAGLRVALEPLS